MSDKEATLRLLKTEYQNLREPVDGLDNDALLRVWFGSWSVRDIVAHVLGWEREMTGALQRMARGERPTAEGVDYSNNDEWNATFVSEMVPISPTTVLAIWGQAHMNFVRAARAVPDHRYGVREDGKLNTVNRLLETSGIGHYREHGAQIHDWRRREGL